MEVIWYLLGVVSGGLVGWYLGRPSRHVPLSTVYRLDGAMRHITELLGARTVDGKVTLTESEADEIVSKIREMVGI